MRYTETRLAAIAYEAMLREINEATVDFSSNFDNSQQEPVILPAKLPILLLNGCSGIAVGMATNIPPHNLGELVDGLIALIDRPELPDEKLWEFIPGPDFPTGGEIIDPQGIRDAYLHGKGMVKVRGVATIEQIRHNKKHSREKTAIILTELPFQVNKAGWIEKVADLVNQGKISEIADIRDESDRQGIRVVIELKRDTDVEVVLDQLYKHTALESNFGVIMLGLVNNRPCQLSLKELLQEFLQFREATLTRQYRHELEQSQARLHLSEGLLAALNNLDTAIAILRNAADGTTAKINLQERLGLSEAQANSILAMPMRRLTGLERKKLETEYRDLQTTIAKLQKLLGERRELLKALKRELRSLKGKFADPRRTKIVSLSAPKTEPQAQAKTIPQPAVGHNPIADKLPDDAVICITEKGYVYWQHSQALPASPPLKKNSDLAIKSELIEEQPQLMVIFDSGKAYPLAVDNLPPYTQKKPLQHLLANSATKDGHQPIGYFFLTPEHRQSNLILLTQQGRLKRIAATELENLGHRGLMLIKLKGDDRLNYLNFAQQGDEVAIASNGGRILRYPVSDEQMPVMGRSAQGNQGIKLRYGEKIVGCTCGREKDNLLLVSELGYGKIIPLKAIRKVKFGELGTQAFRFQNQDDNLVAMLSYSSQKQIILTTNQQRKLAVNLAESTLENKDKYGQILQKLKRQEKILSVIDW
jgi:DNA gyrase subunit A